MFRCYFTNKLSKPGEHPMKLVLETRDKTYFRWNHRTGVKEEIGRGSEIVKEVLVSAEHYNKLMAEGFTPKVVEASSNEEVYHERFSHAVREDLEQDGE